MSLRNKVLDIVKPITLDITQADIDAANANEDSTYNCPGQRAAKRLWPDKRIAVGRSLVTVWPTPEPTPLTAELVGTTYLTGGDMLALFTSRWDQRHENDPLPKPTRIRLRRGAEEAWI